MRVAVAFDHRGVKLRERVLEVLDELGHEAVDLGTDAPEPRIDYPDKAREVGEALRAGEGERGILVCGSGVGASVAANKVRGIRCALCWNEEVARLSRQHNDANVLSLGERVIPEEIALAIVRVWLTTEFEGGRHAGRIAQLDVA